MAISENLPIIVSNLSSAISMRQLSLTGNVQVKTSDNIYEQVSSGVTGAFRVNISQEAKDLQTKEGDLSKKDESEQTEKSHSGESNSREAAGETSESGSSQSIIDQQIKKLLEKIKEIKEKIAALANDNSEAAQLQRKALETQLLELTAQLLSLMNEKAESA